MGDTYTCDFIGAVDFGEGPVRIRCTETGRHDEHKCEVLMGATVPQEGYITKNVFEDDGEAVG